MPRLMSAAGIVVLLLVAWVMSSNRRQVPWRVVIGGIGLQFVLALFILRTAPGQLLFEEIGSVFTSLLGFVDVGAAFVFGINGRPGDEDLPNRITLLRTFAFGVMPTVVFFSSLMAILYHVGIMQWIVWLMGRLMQYTLGTSGAESLSAAANVFVGQTEAPLVVRPYIERMTVSELNALMVGGFSTISGGLLAAYAGMGINPSHLLTASVISAPAALLIAKLMCPETQEPETAGKIGFHREKNAVNVIEAATIGASEGMKLAINVGAMMIAFLALIAMTDAILGWCGGLFGMTGDNALTLARVFGFSFAPIAWIMGIEWADCPRAGELLGVKLAANEFIAYDMLSRWTKEASDVQLSERTVIIMTYALSGFSNFGSIGIQIAGIGSLAETRRGDLARLGLRAMIGGALACCITACIAGVLIA